MNKAYYFLLFILSFTACKSKNAVLKVTTSKHPVIISYSEKHNIVYGMRIPIQLIVDNRSIFSKEFITIDYEYSPYDKGVGEEVYVGNDTIQRIKNNKKKTLHSLGKNKYIIYSRYRIDRFDTSNIFQQQFKPYVAKMLAENKDTLHVGTVTEFKKKHAALFEKLTKGDSISIRFLDDRKFGERVTVPVEWE